MGNFVTKDCKTVKSKNAMWAQPGSGRKMPESSFGRQRQQAVSVIWSEDTFSPGQLFVGLFLQNENLNGGAGDGWDIF